MNLTLRFVTYSVLSLLPVLQGSPVRAADVELPAQYDQHRFFVTPVVAGGETMRLLADTGGGVLLFDDAAMRVKLTVSGVNLNEYKGMAATFPTFEEGKGIPAPKTEGDVIPVVPAPVRTRLSWLTKDIDGIIGQTWFGERVWTLDYPNKKLIYHPDGKAAHSDKATKLALNFKHNSEGKRANHYPRIEVGIGGKTYDMLLATGASAATTADALKIIEEGGRAVRATSLVSTMVFNDWKKEHPQWRVINNAEEDSGEPMIEVPELTIAGFTVGPIWFTRRPDENFTDHFSNWTDKPVEGAIGGNVLKDFRLVLDYPGAVAWVEKP